MNLFGHVIPKKLLLYFGILFVTLIVGLFLFLLVKIIFTKNNPPTQNDLQKYQSNKSLPNITFTCASKLTDRIFGFIVFVAIIFIFNLNTTVALILSFIFGAVLLVFVLGLGQKMISEIEFVTEGIFFYTRFDIRNLSRKCCNGRSPNVE